MRRSSWQSTRARSSVMLVAVGCLGLAAGAPARGPAVRPAANAPERRSDLSLSFEPNVGQVPAPVDFVARGPGYGLALTATQALLALPGAVVGTELRGANTSARATAGDPLPGRVNYLGTDRQAVHVDVPTFGQVGYRGVYDGVDVVYYGARGRLEYDLVARPGADLSQIRIGFPGADAVRLDSGGDLVLDVGAGSLVQHAPVAYQESGGRRRPVAASYVPVGAGEFGLRIGAHDPGVALVVDPVLAYSTYLGGTSKEFGGDIAVDASGSVYVASTTSSFDFPVTPGALPSTRRGNYTMVVSKLSPGGNALVYSTYIGGSVLDAANGIGVDAAGNAYVTGYTSSPDFPTVNALQTSLRGQTDAVVVKLNPTGTALLYSTYLGGSGRDEANAIAVDATGNAYVAGATQSADFPVVNPLQAALAGRTDAFLAKLSPSGSAVAYATYLGGAGDDIAEGVGVDASGSATVGGQTTSDNFPASGVHRGPYDGFVTRLSAGGTSVLYSTYLGGAGSDGVDDLVVDQSGNAYVTGLTESTDFPTVNPVQAANGGGPDAFVAKLSPTGSLAFSTYLGGSGEDLPKGIAVDAAGRVSVTGYTSSTSFPTVRPLQPAIAGQNDAFVATFAPSGSSLVFSSYLGGGANEAGVAVAADAGGSVYVLGETGSADFPTRNAVQTSGPTVPGINDLFVSKITLEAPVTAGSAWYANGTTTQAGPAGTAVSAYAVGAFPSVPYRLVLSRGSTCADPVAVLNATTRFANANGFIPRTDGSIPAGTPPGTYSVCFADPGGATATGVVGFTVR